MKPSCRFCGSPLETIFADLGMSPLSNAYVRPSAADVMEPFYPLVAYVCGDCFLVQVPAVTTPEAIFTDYAYFSSFSSSWVEHARNFAETMIRTRRLDASSSVIEVASNDGYLLRWFRDAGIPVLGIEPARNVADAAIADGIPTISRFFGAETARDILGERGPADLLIGNNVLAHVPDLNDFVAGLKILLAPTGLITMEFPHLLRLIEGNQFDTIYHEHFSYFSLATVRAVFRHHGLAVFDVDELPTHGGSLRIHAAHGETAGADRQSILHVLDAENAAGLDRIESYSAFRRAVDATKRDLLQFLITARNDGRKVAGYGAPAKGNTLLNYCGIRSDFLEFTVDRNPHKQGLLLPGTHIEIREPEALRTARPDYVLILPWNLRDEIVEQTSFIREWGARWVVAIPRVAVIE